MRPAFDQALAARDSVALEEARLEATADLATLYGDLRRVRPLTRLWIQVRRQQATINVADSSRVCNNASILLCC